MNNPPPQIRSSHGMAHVVTPTRTIARRALRWVASRKKAAAIGCLAFLAGAFATKGFDVVWNRVFPPKDLTPQILSASQQGVAEAVKTRTAILEAIRLLPARLATTASPGQEVQRVGRMVEHLADVATGLGSLNTVAIRAARGEEVQTWPRFAQGSAAPALDAPEIRIAPEMAPFPAGGVGGGMMTAAEQAADMTPNLWVRIGEIRLIANAPARYIRLLPGDSETDAVTVMVSAPEESETEQPWQMTQGSFLEINQYEGTCTLTYVRSRYPAQPSGSSGAFHGFLIDCNATDPTQPPSNLQE